MLSAADLREWAGVTDDSKDDVLALIAAGSLDLLSRTTGRILRTPPAAYEQVLDVPETVSGGLSRSDPSSLQKVLLREEPNRTLTGTVSVAVGGTTVTGTSTLFTAELSADPASAVEIAGEVILVASITSDTELELAEAHVAGAAGATAYADVISLESRPTHRDEWETEDPRDFELTGRWIFTRDRYLYAGERTLRARYLVGSRQGEEAPGVDLHVARMVKVLYAKKAHQARSISVDGAIDLEWSDFGKEGAELEAQACKLARPLIPMYPGRFLTGGSSTW